MEKKVIYYEGNRGRKPAKEFINAFEAKTEAKILARIGYLQEHWHEARRPLVDYVDEDEKKDKEEKNNCAGIY